MSAVLYPVMYGSVDGGWLIGIGTDLENARRIMREYVDHKNQQQAALKASLGDTYVPDQALGDPRWVIEDERHAFQRWGDRTSDFDDCVYIEAIPANQLWSRL